MRASFANRVANTAKAYGADTLAGKALAALEHDLGTGRARKNTLSQIEAIEKDESFAGSTVLEVLVGGREHLLEGGEEPTDGD